MKKLMMIALILMIAVTAAAVSAAEQQPLKLTDLDYFEKESMDLDPYSNECRDPYGNIYTSCLGPRGHDGFVEFLLNRKYSKLTGTLYATGVKLNETYDYNWDFATCSIYGDDSLLFTHSGFHRKDDPVPFELDVRGIRFLRIVFEGAGYYNTGTGRPLILLGDLYLEPEAD